MTRLSLKILLVVLGVFLCIADARAAAVFNTIGLRGGAPGPSLTPFISFAVAQRIRMEILGSRP